MKKKFAILMLMSILFTFTVPIFTVHAEGNGLVPEGFDQNLQTLKGDGIVARIIVTMSEWFFKIPGINSLGDLVYGQSGTVFNNWMKTSNKEYIYGLFGKDTYDTIILPLMHVFSAGYVGFITIAIMVSALKFGLKAWSPQAKADFWKDVMMWVMSALFIGTYSVLITTLLEMNDGIVQSIGKMLGEGGANKVSIIASAGSNIQISDLLVMFVEWGISAYVNFIYISRQIVIMFLMALAPVAAISMLYAKTRSFLGTYIKELAGNIFLQSVHAVVLFVFAKLAADSGSFYKLGMLLMFVPITGMIARLMNLGDSSSSIGRMLTSTGFSALGTAYMMSRKAGNVLSGARAEGMVGLSSAIPTGDDGSGTKISEIAKGGKGWNKIKSGVGTLGSVAGGLFGLGAAGPVGVALGAIGGKKLAEGTAQFGRNLSTGFSNTGKHLVQLIQNKKNNGKVFSDLAERREWFGGLGESLGTIVGAGNVGRDLGHIFSLASQRRIQSDELEGMKLEDVAKKYNDIKFIQDNQGSAYYADLGNGKLERVSAIGAADPTLRNGERRVIDYKTNTGPVKRNPNGSIVAQRINTSIYSAGGQDGILGLAGSTPNLLRTSGAYIQDEKGVKYEDNRIDPGKINPDSYFSHSVAGRSNSLKENTTDFLAGQLPWQKKAKEKISAWFNSEEQTSEEQTRHPGIL